MHTSRRAVAALLAALVLVAPTLAAPPHDLPAHRGIADAERLFDEGSYGLARQAYESLAASTNLDPAHARWISMRAADAQLRSLLKTSQRDRTVFETPVNTIEAIIEATPRDARDATWAAAEVALGDFHMHSRNMDEAWRHYTPALDYWAASTDLDRAREQWLAIVRRAVMPAWSRGPYFWGVSTSILRDAVSIVDADERGLFGYLLAKKLETEAGSLRVRRQIVDAYQAVIELGKAEPWYDDALFNYGTWLEQQGGVGRQPNGSWYPKPDFVKALATYRRLIADFGLGRSQYRDKAEARVNEITKRQVQVHAPSTYVPGSEIALVLQWRNLDRIRVTLHPVDLAALPYPRKLDAFSPKGSPAVEWDVLTNDAGHHLPGQREIRVPRPVPTGAYVATAFKGSTMARTLVLVTDLAVVTKSSGTGTDVYCCDAISGAPVANATITAHIGQPRNTSRTVTMNTDERGLAHFDRRENDEWHRGEVIAQAGSRTALTSSGLWHRSGPERWRFHAFTDRPAYRPGETAHFKVIAREGDDRRTPAGATLKWSILDPQGSTVLEEEGVLNDFGTLWGSVDLTSEMPLGAYRVQFNDGSRDLGAATIFRLEEYKLPEFTVRVTPAMDGDAPRVLRPGQEAVIDILAEYTFGGPVAGAQVEAVVSSSPYWMQSPIVRPYPWCYEQPRRGWQPRNVVHRVTLETDAEGRATLRVPPQQADHDIELGIEARVTDSSRREITGTGIVRVTLQGYAVRLEPSHRVVRPGARTEITVRAIDANQRPRSVTGKVTIERQTWRERWIDPRGVEHTVAPRLSRDRIGWTCDRRAYEYEEVLSTSVTTDDEGRGAIAFSPEVAGVYRVTWRSPDDPINGDSEEDELLRDWIEAETLIWAADPSTTEVVHEPTTGIDIIIDRDTFRAGETAPVMLVADATGRWVLFGVEDDSIHDLQVIQMTGDARIVQLPIGIEHQPNVYLHATSVHDGAAAMDTVEVVVPPIDEYLEVVVALDRDAYEPGETGVITVHTTDQDGNPVPAEVGLALIDESILAIQQPFAGDPRKTFFSGRRGHGVRTRASCGSPYVRLVQDPAGDGLVDERVLATGEDRVLELPEQSRDWFGGAVMVDGAMAESQGRGRGNAMRQMAPSSPAGAAPMEMAAADKALSGGEAGGPEDLGNVTVRSDFRSTLLWLPDLTTDEDGAASAEVTFADSLTTWRATARCATTGVQFGMSTANAKTRKPLIARLQAPRFFVVGDETVLSGVLNNNTDEAMQVTVGLQADGLAMRGLMLDGRVQGGERTVVTIPAGGEARVDFSVLAEVSGTANVTLSARAGKHDDGMTKTYPIEAHGIEQLIAHATVLRDGDVTINVELPRARSDTTLAVQVAPSLAVTMLDALPYLVDYPYGCTEQTMSRFLPAVITASTLRDLKLDPDAAMARVFGGIEQAHVDKTHPKKGAGLDALADVFRTSVARLEDTQNADGGWGWWPEGQSDRFMTAYVVWGLALARQAGADVAPTALGRAQKWLDEALVKDERSPSSQAWLLHAAAVAAAITERREGADLREAALENIIASREGLPIYGIALTALAAHEMREPATAEMLARNLASAVKRDNAPGRSIVVRDGARGGSATATAHWGETARWWRWHDGAVETTSFAIRALLAIDPDNELIAPAVNWLIGNRRAAQWSNTRDTAIAVLTLNDYLKVSGELANALTYEIAVNGTVVETRSVEPKDGITAPTTFMIDTALLRDGVNQVTIRRTDGDGPLYLAARARYFSLEEPVPPAGNQVFARRDYHRLAPVKTLLRGYRNERSELPDEGYLDSGDRVEVVITLEAKNDLEYVMIEDLKPAGLEAIDAKSGMRVVAKRLTQAAATRSLGRAPGEAAAADRGDATGRPEDYTGQRLYAYQELRDRKVALFLDRLPEGIWEIRYTLRGEVPGRYHAMPTIVQGMYVPEIRGNSAERRITVGE